MSLAAEERLASVPLKLRLGSNHRAVPQLQLRLLGGFRAEREDDAPISGWQRRSAKTLTKLLATSPGHALHREQVMDTLWPGVELESALNSFGKALYAARRALEPDLLPRESSAYLRLTDSMVALEPEHVWIDADHFEQLAERALRVRDVAAYEAALAAYDGELLPEERYEDWCSHRRDSLAELHVGLLIGFAEALARRGDYGAAAARLREVLLHDPTREDVHRRLMAVYVAAGTRDQAIRQFHLCQDTLKRELDLPPGDATKALYDKIVADRSAPGEGERERAAAPFAGRALELEQLDDLLAQAADTRGRLVLVHGEAGVGKSRLVTEFATAARRRGCCVLGGGSDACTNDLAYGPFAVALEGYAASRSAAERHKLAQRYPALADFVPSLGFGRQGDRFTDRSGEDQLYLVPAIVRLLTDLAKTRPVVIVLGDLNGLDRSSLSLLGYLAPLAADRRWLIVGTYGEDALAPGSELRRMVDATERERLSVRIELERLARRDCDALVRALLPGRSVDPCLLDQIFERSLGNPLFIEELVREMSSAASPGVPSSVRARVAQRVADVDQNVRRVLALAAAGNGKGITFAALRTGAAAVHPPLSEVALLDALDRALELRILEERNGSYAFRHPLVRSALYESLSTHRRDELNAALGRSRATGS